MATASRIITPGRCWHTPEEMAAPFRPQIVGGTDLEEAEAAAARAEEIRELYESHLEDGERIMEQRRKILWAPNLEAQRFRVRTLVPIDDGKPHKPGEITALMCWLERRVRELGSIRRVEIETGIPHERIRSKLRSLKRNRLVQLGIALPTMRVMASGMQLVDNVNSRNRLGKRRAN